MKLTYISLLFILGASQAVWAEGSSSPLNGYLPGSGQGSTIVNNSPFSVTTSSSQINSGNEVAIATMQAQGNTQNANITGTTITAANNGSSVGALTQNTASVGGSNSISNQAVAIGNSSATTINTSNVVSGSTITVK